MIDTSHFTGGDDYFRHDLARNFRYTEGVRFVAEAAEAYWLLDVVFSYQHELRAINEEFQVWTLTPLPDDGALVTMTDGNTSKPIIQQKVSFTDFPFDQMPDGKMVMWLSNHVLYLPSEH
jgi:hypothetical protein